jgi:hypothetical protein
MFSFELLKITDVYGRSVVKALCYKPEGLGLENPRGEKVLLIYLTLPAVLFPGCLLSF